MHTERSHTQWTKGCDVLLVMEGKLIWTPEKNSYS